MKITLFLFLFTELLLSYTLPKTEISLVFEEADIKAVLNFLAVKSGINIVYTDDVVGDVTINLKKVPFDKAFETLLKIKGLVYTWEAKNIIKVTTPSTLAKERGEAITTTKIFTLKYALPEDVKTQLDSLRALEGRKGLIVVDKLTNSLVVTDTPEGLEFVEKYIKEIDKKPQMVTIEANFYDVSLEDISEIGINWSYIKGKEAVADALKGKTGPEKTGIIVETLFPSVGGLNLSIGHVTDASTFWQRFGVLISKGKVKLIANPRVTSLNNEEAKILIGDKLPYKVTMVPGPGQPVVETTQFLDVGVKLTVTPSISADKWITMKIKPEVSSVKVAPAPGAAPSVTTREAEVKVMIKNGDTLVIGGLTKEIETVDIRKIPLLGDIPIIGYLFKYKTTTLSKTELLVFLSPKIIEEF